MRSWVLLDSLDLNLFVRYDCSRVELGERKRQITGSIAGWEWRVVCVCVCVWGGGGGGNVGVVSVSDRPPPSSLAPPPPNPPPPPPPHGSSSAMIVVLGLSLNLSLFWLICWPFSFSPRVARRCTKAQIGDTALGKEIEEVSIPQLLPLRTWQPFFFFLPEIKLTRLWSGLHLKKI